MLQRIFILGLTTAFATLLATAHGAQIPGPIVILNETIYRGVHNDALRINSYYNIPYAAPPVGALRFQPPQPFIPPNSHNDTAAVDASQPGPSCVQGHPFWTGVIGPVDLAGVSEDCLNLHVYIPDYATPESKLPVMFYIHGGGYTTGYATPGEAFDLMRHSNNSFVFVSIQYRLGAYGFTGGPKFVKEGGAQNLGLRDQRFALQWVQKNVAALGGDPEKVTIMGGSAGGGSVTAMMAWKGGDVHQLEEKPLFRGAMADYPWWQPYRSAEQLDAQYELLLNTTGCPDLECLKNVDEGTLNNATQKTFVTAYQKGMYGYGNFYYGPYVDGEYLRDLPSKELENGNFMKVPTWVIREGYEGASFSNKSITTMAEEVGDLKALLPYANDSFIEKLYELYPSKDFNSTYFHRVQWFGDITINCPTRFIADAVAKSNTTVYKQIFNVGSQIHGATVPFLFDLNYDSTPGANVTLSNAIKDWYVSFAIHLDPNAESWSNVSKIAWPEYNKGGEVLSLNYTQMGVVSDMWYDNTKTCEFFRQNDEVLQN